MTRPRNIRIGHKPWTIHDVVAVAEGRAQVEFRPNIRTLRQLRAGVRYVEHLWRHDQRLYGVTTGFGASVDRPVPIRLVGDLSRQLARYHGCGLGRQFGPPETLAILATRL